MQRAAALVVLACAIACKNSTGNANGNTIAGAADISGNWGGHGDGQQSFDSLTVTISQLGSGDTLIISGGGTYWADTSPQGVRLAGIRVKDSLFLNFPDSAGTTPPDTLKFYAVVSKDSFGDELVGLWGPGDPTRGFTFTLHRR